MFELYLLFYLVDSVGVPLLLPPSHDPRERAKDASGMRLNGYTTQEIDTLERLTAADCSATPSLIATKVDVQDESVLNSKNSPEFQDFWGDVQLWMPGGYIVYILMSKISAQPLDINSFWNERMFTKQDRHDVRVAFREAYLYVDDVNGPHDTYHLPVRSESWACYAMQRFQTRESDVG